MGNKVTFYPLTRIIQVTVAPTLIDGEWIVDLDVNTDIYSDGKEDWKDLPALVGFKFPVRYAGGDDIPGSEKQLGVTHYIRYGWKIRPYEASHVFRIDGNLYSEDYPSPFIQTVGTYNVMVQQKVSNLVDSTVVQLSEIEYASFNGGVSIDTVNGYAGTEKNSAGVIIGTPQAPSNNLTDALTILTSRGLPLFYVIGDLDIDDSQDYTGLVFVGESMTKSEIDIDSSADVTGAEFSNASILGTLDGNAKLEHCRIKDLSYISGYIELCVLEGTATLGGGSNAFYLDCWAGTKKANPPEIDMGGSGQTLVMQNFNGAVKIKNKTGASDECNISLNAGMIIIADTVTAGDINVMGTGVVFDELGNVLLTGNHNGANIDTTYLMNPPNITNDIMNYTGP